MITIEKGETVKGAATILRENKIIRSSVLFNILIAVGGNHVVEGDYFFYTPINIFQVFNRVSSGSYEIPTQSVTLFEGMTSEQMTESLKEVFPNFDATGFLTLAEEKEGYLFPDTYEFPTNVSPEKVIETLEENFNLKVEENRETIEESKYSLEEIIIMASIIEKEASRDTIQEISNILWKRIEIGMPLQVDAPFVYAINKSTFELTLDDLKEDHEYNTYTNKGLTPTAISNPGLEAMLAAAHPEKTSHLYFLTGSNGVMYFATNFESHKRNKALYLD